MMSVLFITVGVSMLVLIAFEAMALVYGEYHEDI